MATPPMMTTEVTSNLTKTTMTVEPVFNNSGNGSNPVFENPFNQPSVRVTFILLYSIVFTMCFLGNIVVLVVFAYSKRMRTRTNLFLANLAVADFCVGVFCVLPSLSIQLSPFWTLGRVMCKLYFFVNYLAYTASILLLVVIAVERYIAIMHPLRSRGYFTAPRLLVAQVVVWVVAAAYNIPILMMFDTTETPLGSFCYLTVSNMNLKAYYTAHFVLWYLLPLTVILVMYGRISCTLWATSATAVPVSRADSRGSVSLTVALDTQAHHHHHHHHHQHHHTHTQNHHHQHHHHQHNLGTNVGRSSVSYCDMVGENGFGSVLTVGALAGHDAGRNGDSGSVESRRSDGRGVYGSNSRLVEGEEGGRGLARNSSRGVDLDKTAQRLLACSCPGEADAEQMEMVVLNGCSNCFSCVQSRAAAGGGSSSYLHRLDNAHTLVSPAGGKRHNKKHLNVDDYAYEMSDIPSSDDYDSYQSRGEGGYRMGTGAADAKYFGNGYGGNGAPRRLRTHCRISSQRGLTSRRRVIRLLVAVVTIFAICVFPYHLRNLLHIWDLGNVEGLYDYLAPISSVMMYLNCGLNPFIYWMFSDHFRRSLKETLCFWKRSQRSISRVMLSSPRQNKTFSIKPFDAM